MITYCDHLLIHLSLEGARIQPPTIGSQGVLTNIGYSMNSFIPNNNHVMTGAGIRGFFSLRFHIFTYVRRSVK